MNFNKIIMIGRIVNNLDLLEANSNLTYIKFNLAVNEFKNSVIENTIFVKCIAFKETAKYLFNYANKGYLILVEGKLKLNTYIDKENIKREKIEILVDTAKILQKIENIDNTKEKLDSNYINNLNDINNIF